MTVTFSDIEPELNSGDLVLFSGNRLHSRLIQFVTFSRWSHIGMVMRLPEFSYPLLLESTSYSNVAELYSGEEREGVQLVPLRERVERYPGQVAVRQLQGNRLDTPAVEQLIRLKKELYGRSYEINQQEMMLAVYDGPFGINEPDLSSLFCSELVAELYQQIGLLKTTTVANEYTPADFGARRLSQLDQGFYLSPEIRLS